MLQAVAALVVSFFFHAADTPLATAEHLVSAYMVFTSVCTLRQQINFYRWWSSSAIHDAQRRGLSTCGYPLFGVVPFPRLSVATFTALELGLVLGWALTFLSSSHTAFLVCGTLQTLAFSQLWAEDSAAYHREALLVTFFLYALWPGDTGTLIALFKLHVASVYFCGGVQKVLFSLWRRRAWFACAPHTLVWNGMWASKSPSQLQIFAIQSPYLMATAGFAVLALELLLPAQTLFWPSGGRAASLALCAFHTSVDLLQGVNYLTYWNAVVVTLGAVDTPAVWEWSAPTTALAAMPFALCAFQLLYGLLFFEDFNINAPPFTCCPMFVNPSTMTERIPQTFLMRAPPPVPGLDFPRLEWMFPYAHPESGLGLIHEDLEHMPFRFLLFGDNPGFEQIPTIQRRWLTYDAVGEKEFFFFTNTDASDELIDLLAKLLTEMHYKSPDTVAAQYDRRFLTRAAQTAWAARQEFSKTKAGPVRSGVRKIEA